MKEKSIEIDLKRGIDLLNRVLRLFPFRINTNEQYLNILRKSRINYVWDNFWVSYLFDLLDQKGYNLEFEFPYHSRYERYDFKDYYGDIDAITNKIFEYLDRIEKKPKKDIYLKNREFISLRLFFEALYNALALEEERGGWKSLFMDRNDEDARHFVFIFGFLKYSLSEYITTPEEFCNSINSVLRNIGYQDFSLNADGILRYFGTTAEAEEMKRAYNLLSKNKYENVIENLDNINDHINNKKYSDALASCRKGLESFYKRFLINHGITTLHNGKNTDNGVVSNLAETIKQNILKLFNFPSYSQNLDTQGYFHLIESSKFIISGIANPGGSHGKSSPPKVNYNDVKVAQSFLILLINTFLPFEK